VGAAIALERANIQRFAVSDKKRLTNSLALIKGAKEALQRDDLPPQVRARLEKAREIGEAGLKRELENTDEPAGNA
jgi:hypothetical protein